MVRSLPVLVVFLLAASARAEPPLVQPRGDVAPGAAGVTPIAGEPGALEAASASAPSPAPAPSSALVAAVVAKLDEGDRAFAAGDYRGALFAYQDAVYLQPVSAVARVRLGRAYLALRYPEQAQAQAEQALAVDPASADARRLAEDCGRAPPPRPVVPAAPPATPAAPSAAAPVVRAPVTARGPGAPAAEDSRGAPSGVRVYPLPGSAAAPAAPPAALGGP
jgi:hypothetical protein